MRTIIASWPNGTAWLLLACCVLAAPLRAQEESTAASGAQGDFPTVSLQALLDRVESRPVKRFLVDRHAQRQIYLAGTPPEQITYPVLLGILRANGLAAVEIEGIVNIVPVQQIRSYPVPMVEPSDSGIPDDEWVGTIVQLRSMDAAQAVPVLRPLMPVEAHLAAMPPSTIMIVDRFANMRRVVGMLRELDRTRVSD
jgi:general secretion pathway protein D